MDIRQIIKGWYEYFRGTIFTKQLMEKRLLICDACPNKVQVSSLGKVLVQLVNHEGTLIQCGKCSCPLAAKTANPNSQCPEKRWLKVNEESYF